jgi:predicted nucleotidyltransferase
VSDVPAARRADVVRLTEDLTAWARRRPDVEGLVLVGSYARDQAGPDSDVDVVVLSPEHRTLADDHDWFPGLRPGARLVQERVWGPVLERRWRLPSGLVVELGLAAPGWAAVPLDDGTARVLRDGCRVLHDPVGLLAGAVAALGPASP